MIIQTGPEKNSVHVKVCGERRQAAVSRIHSPNRRPYYNSMILFSNPRMALQNVISFYLLLSLIPSLSPHFDILWRTIMCAQEWNFKAKYRK